MSSDPQELLYDDALKVAHMVEARANGLADDMVKSLEAVRFTLLARMAELQEKTLASTSWEEQTLARRKAYLEAQREAVDSIISEVYSGMSSTIQDAHKMPCNIPPRHKPPAFKLPLALVGARPM